MKIFGKEIRCIDECKEAWKLWSMRMFAFLVVMPEIYNIVAAYASFEAAPEGFKITVQVLAMIGGILRLISQKKKESE